MSTICSVTEHVSPSKVRVGHRGTSDCCSVTSNGSTEAATNNLIKIVKRIAFGFRRFTSFRIYRIRTLLSAGRPSWDLLANITPTSP
jgi:hypothetical protein